MSENEQGVEVDRDGSPRIYPCARCGTMRSKPEGGTTFTVCDECWEILRAEDAVKYAATRQQPADFVQRQEAVLRELNRLDAIADGIEAGGAAITAANIRGLTAKIERTALAAQQSPSAPSREPLGPHVVSRDGSARCWCGDTHTPAPEQPSESPAERQQIECPVCHHELAAYLTEEGTVAAVVEVAAPTGAGVPAGETEALLQRAVALLVNARRTGRLTGEMESQIREVESNAAALSSRTVPTAPATLHMDNVTKYTSDPGWEPTTMVVCPDCGNKRCPKANDPANACTGSNAPGQPGSAYPAPATEQEEA